MIGFYTFASVLTERQLLNSAPKPVSIYDSRVHLRFDLDTPSAAGPPALHQHRRRPAAGAEPPGAPGRAEQADHRDHRRRADGAHRGARGGADLPAVGADRPGHAGRSEALRQRGHPRLELRPDRRLLLHRASSTSSRRWPASRRAWPPTARPTTSARSSSTASSAAAAPAGRIRPERYPRSMPAAPFTTAPGAARRTRSPCRRPG